MEILEKDIENAKKYIYFEKNASDFAKYCNCFLFGTENQEGINEVISYQNKDVLTPASSGDQFLAAVYYGAQNVDVFDINRFTNYITSLKIAAIQTLDYKEFLNFMVPFFNDNLSKHFWDLNTFKKLLPNMPKDSTYFWENILFLFKRQEYGNFLILKHLSTKFANIVNGMPFYAREEEYYKLQKTLRNREYPSFIEANLINIKTFLKNDYDIIYLSNIVECLVVKEMQKFSRSMGFSPHLKESSIEKDISLKIIKEVLNNLKDDSTILIDYRPNSNLRYSDDFLFNNSFFKATEIKSKIQNVENYNGFINTDLVLTYKPSKAGKIDKMNF